MQNMPERVSVVKILKIENIFLLKLYVLRVVVKLKLNLLVRPAHQPYFSLLSWLDQLSNAILTRYLWHFLWILTQSYIALLLITKGSDSDVIELIDDRVPLVTILNDNSDTLLFMQDWYFKEKLFHFQKIHSCFFQVKIFFMIFTKNQNNFVINKQIRC